MIITRKTSGDSDNPDTKHNNSNCHEKLQPKHIEKEGIFQKYFLLLIGLFVIEQLIVASLIHTGIVEKSPFQDINEIVLGSVNTVIPHMNVSFDSLAHSLSSERRDVGHALAKQGAQAKYPIVMIPGFVTSGLEVWAGKECAKGFFRQRIWAAMTGARSFFVEHDCWKDHMMLDPLTGGDPDDIRVRASEGFAATDFFIGNYWVWDKLFKNLAMVGYSPSNMVIQPYDWRLPFSLLEERDGYFTNLKYRIEAMHKKTGTKVVLASHSMGAMVVHHFFGWVTTSEKKGGGGGGNDWVDKHVDIYINIAGSHLGVPKAATALLSGEMSDTVLGGSVSFLLENFFGRRMRRELWSSWGSLWAMLPKGGDLLWGPGDDLCTNRSIDDQFCPPENNTISPLIVMTDEFNCSDILDKERPSAVDPFVVLQRFDQKQLHTLESLIEFLVHYGNGLGRIKSATFHSQLKGDATPEKSWYDVTQTPLPYAPKLVVYCLYGIGLPTERAYYYKRNREDNVETKSKTNTSDPAVIMDTTVNQVGIGVKNGIRFSDGDGSVPLLSLGYVCADAWKREGSGLNPTKAQIYTREYMHKAEFCADDPMRGGPAASDHVGILGNSAVMEDFIRIVTNFETEVVANDHIESDILKIAEKINTHPRGGIFKKEGWVKRNWVDLERVVSWYQRRRPW